jgi:hypothetical protein
MKEIREGQISTPVPLLAAQVTVTLPALVAATP